MLLTLLRELEFLSSSFAPQLVVGLALCGIVLLVVSDRRLAIPIFLVQRLIVIALFWSAVELPLGGTSLVASASIALIYAITELRLWFVERRETGHVNRDRSPAIHFSIRVLAAALGLLVTYGLVQTYVLDLLHSPVIAYPATLLFVNGLLLVLLADSPLQVGMGILTFADGLRVLYALWGPNVFVWGVWAASDVLVALGASHLRNIKVTLLKAQAAGVSK